MAAKSLLVFVASACFFKVISSQSIGAINGPALAAEELALTNALAFSPGIGPFGAAFGPGYAPNSYGLNVAPTSGGGFAVTSSSPIAPTGISVVSENTIEGPITITGQLPFLGAIALEGALPTAGAGAINYGCGTGSVGIVSEGIAPAPAAYPAGLGYGAPSLGYPGAPGSRPFNPLGPVY